MAMAFGNVFAFAGFFLISKGARAHIDVLPFQFGAIPGRHDRGDRLRARARPFPRHLANVPPGLRLGQPVLSGALAYVFLGGVITLAHVAGGLLTLVGVPGAATVDRT